MPPLPSAPDLRTERHHEDRRFRRGFEAGVIEAGQKTRRRAKINLAKAVGSVKFGGAGVVGQFEIRILGVVLVVI